MRQFFSYNQRYSYNPLSYSHVSTLISSIHNDQYFSPSAIPSLRKHQVTPDMRRKDRTCESVPQESITSDNYLIQLLREEEIIEAIGMVDPEQASEMARKLDEDLQGPWHYLDKHNTIPADKRLESFQKLKQEAEEADKVEAPEPAPENEALESKALVKYSPSAIRNFERISVKNPRIRRPSSHKGTYTWSGRVFHLKQEPKYAAKDKLIADEKPFTTMIRTGILKTPENQFYNHNMEKDKEILWKVPEELVYRPFDAARMFADEMRERPLRIAAKQIRIFVAQH
jgi:hypothetical protein